MSNPAQSYEPQTSENAAVILVDHQVGLMSGVRDYSIAELKHNVVGLAKAVLGGIVALPAVNSISTYPGKRVTNEARSYRDSRRKAEEITVLLLIAAGETGRMPAPKEQPPRKLSGKRTAQSHKLWKETRTLERDSPRPPTG